MSASAAPVALALASGASRPVLAAAPVADEGEFLGRWLESQALNSARHRTALRPFRPHEFGTDPASPTEAHRVAANELIVALHQPLGRVSAALDSASSRAAADPSPARIQIFTARKEEAQRWVEAVEKVWHFYLELFNQRRTQVAGFLLGCDRIALDCYQAVYTNLGVARSIPSPPPFSYMEGGFGPATFRRQVVLTKLGRRANPFPLVKLPYHRLVNPWTLGAVPHEVAHNIQSDLGLWDVMPREIFRALRSAGLPAASAATWARWHKETFADMLGVLLIGPAFVTSLMDVVAKSPLATMGFNPRGVHPTPYLRVFLNLELLGRLDFPDDCAEIEAAWRRLYPAGPAGLIPASMLSTFREAARSVVDVMCYQRFRQLGDRSLADVVAFTPRHQAMVHEASERLAAAVDPGILPERFLIAAARWAHDHRLASPAVIARNFYQALGRR